jgi:septum formation protein
MILNPPYDRYYFSCANLVKAYIIWYLSGMKALLTNRSIVLASKSPRRKYLLEQAGLVFSVEPSSIDESAFSLSAPADYVRILALAKTDEISRRFPDSWVIGADTIVLIDDTVLGKPRSKIEARDMLTRLSGRSHQVITGYSIQCRTEGRRITDTSTTDVLFKTMTTEEIEWYIHTREPFDKAGGYAIQGLGTALVKSINGSYTTVVGLPVCEVIDFLIREGVLERNAN